jgi:hypothetical protein
VDAQGNAAATATPTGLGPSDLQAVYAIPNLGVRATIAIVDPSDDPNAEADLATY